jgi:YgiT-type zinc finger domain-containing protein
MICKQGHTQPAQITIVLERNGYSWKKDGVPAQVCDMCGESFIDEADTAQLLEQAEASINADTEKVLYHFLVN